MSERLCTFISRIAAVLVCITGVAVLVGWMANVSFLKGGFWSGITVKTNAGIGLVLIGAALGLSQLPATARWATAAARLMAAVAAVLGGLTLLQHLSGWDFHLDQLVMREPPGEKATISPNRMGPPASTCFLLGGAALVLLTGRTGHARRSRDTASVLAVTTGLIALFPALGYLFGASELYQVARFTGIALPTAITFLVFALGLFCATRGSRALSLLESPSAGGVMMRRLLLPAVFLPPLLAYLRTIGESAGHYDAPFGRALLVISFIVVFAALIWISARQLDAVDLARSNASLAREQLLESERKARAEAEQASRLKDEFLATLSHELRTPLNAILGWAQLLQRRKTEDELDEGLAVIERNARAQTQLISDLLDMSRIASGKLKLDMQKVGLADVARAAIDSVHPSAQAKGVAIKTAFEANIDGVRGDPAKLQQVVWNLLTNAIKFSGKGKTVSVAIRRAAGDMELSVTDEGSGISPAFLPFVFDRFRQADGSITRRHGGLGIGLTIVKTIVEAHGGTVTAASPGEGKGATFTVTLPLPAAHQSDADLAANPVKDGPDGFNCDEMLLSGLKVLVVDDDPDARDLIRRLLEKCRARAIVAADAHAAIGLLEQERPDVLVSDIGMPGMDGYDLIETIRRLPPDRGGATPAAALTALVRSEDRQRALRAGFQSHVSKPIAAAELVGVVAGLSGRTAAATTATLTPAPALTPEAS